MQVTDLGAAAHPVKGIVLCLAAALSLVAVTLVDDLYLYGLALGLALCVAAPFAVQWARGRVDYFASIHVLGLLYFIYFGLGAVWTVRDPLTVAYDLEITPHIPKALLYCLLGYLALLAGYHAVCRRKTSPPPAERPAGAVFLVATAALGTVGYVASRLVERAMVFGGSVPAGAATLSQLAPLFLFAWALGWLVFFSGAATDRQRLVLFGLLLPGALATALVTFSDKSLLMTLVGIPIIARWYGKRRIPWALLVALLLLLLFVIFPFYNTYRSSDPTLGQADRMRNTYSAVQAWDSERYLRFSAGSFMRRMAMINSVAVVVRDVDRWVPYARGSTLFTPVVINFVPRLLWPEKPMTTLGREFGQTFRITNTSTRATYIAVTTPGELYWNFGLPGVLLGMGLLGMTLRWLYRRFGESSEDDTVRRAIHIWLVVVVAHLGGALAVTVAMVAKTLILLTLLRMAGRYLRVIETLPLSAGKTP